VDFGLIFFLAELCHVWYVAATALGALAGAITNFVMNRHWSFLAADHHWSHQAKRYALVSGASLLLNTFGVYLMTEALHVHYSVSVVVISFLVGWAFNFPLHRHYVFR
jgi:putative flippase GtrA